MEVGGLVEVMSWVMGFGRQAEVLELAHLRKAVAQELDATIDKYSEAGKLEERKSCVREAESLTSPR